MKALLFTIGLIMVISSVGANELGDISGTQQAIQVLIAFALIAISALCPGKEDV